MRMSAFPLGLLGTLILIAGVEGLIVRHPYTTLSGFQWEYRRAREKADAGVNDCSILAFGDSMLKLGLVPEALHAATGKRAYNFAITGSQAPAAYMLLKRSLDAGARPSAVLIECFPRLLAIDPSYNTDHWPFLLDAAEAFEITAGRGQWRAFAAQVVKTCLPSARSTPTLRKVIMQALNDQPNIEREGNVIGLRNWEVNAGFQNNEHAGPPRDLPSWQLTYFRQRAAHPTNRSYVERFLALAEAHGIAVFWLLPPYQPTLQAACEASGYDRFHEDWVRDLARRHPRLRVIDGRHGNYDPAAFMDPHHLISPGAQVFSAEVGEVLRRFYADPGALASSWIELPAYRARPVAARVESLDESRTAVIDAGLLRR